MTEDEAISRVLSHALRHEPEKYGISLDPEGWVSVDSMVRALRMHGFPALDVATVTGVVDGAQKKRHEMRDGRIRARYGHSVDVDDALVGHRPPVELFHGTSPEAAESILRQGLKPMARRYVHLSSEVAAAEAVARRRTATPVILVVHAEAASDAGVRFEQREQNVWVTEPIPAQFISLSDRCADDRG